MSLVISITMPQAIIMASDTKIITTSQECKEVNGILIPKGNKKIEASQHDKTFEIPKIGAISFWGEATNTHIEISNFIRDKVSNEDDINSIADKFFIYLTDEIRPDEEIGFHLGGFDRRGNRRLYHIFYSVQIGQEEKGVDFYKNIEDDGSRFIIVFNGKNRYTAEAMLLYKDLERHGYLISPSKHRIEENIELAVALINHTARIIHDYEGIQSVGGDVNVFVISLNNEIQKHKKPCSGELESYLRHSGDSIPNGSGIIGQFRTPTSTSAES